MHFILDPETRKIFCSFSLVFPSALRISRVLVNFSTPGFDLRYKHITNTDVSNSCDYDNCSRISFHTIDQNLMLMGAYDFFE